MNEGGYVNPKTNQSRNASSDDNSSFRKHLQAMNMAAQHIRAAYAQFLVEEIK